jgi:hypothetical protein
LFFFEKRKGKLQWLLLGPQTVNKGRVKLERSSWRCKNEKVTINNRIKEDEITQELLER